jgi:hypothetical protein
MVRATAFNNPDSASAPNADWSRDLIEAIAKDVGEAVVAHVEIMYPAAIDASPTTFRLSLRNTVMCVGRGRLGSTPPQKATPEPHPASEAPGGASLPTSGPATPDG